MYNNNINISDNKNEDDNIKIKLINRFFYSFNPQKYKLLSKGTMGGYIGMIILLFLVTILVSIVKLSVFISYMGGLDTILDSIPDFEYSDSSLNIKEESVTEENGMLIKVSNYNEYYTEEDISSYLDGTINYICLVGSKNIAIYDENGFISFDLADFSFLDGLTKNYLENTVRPVFSVLVVMYYVLNLVISVGWFFVTNLLYWLVATIFASGIFKIKLSFSEYYKIALCSRIPVEAVNIALQLIFITLGGSGLTFSFKFMISCMFIIFGLKNYVIQDTPTNNTSKSIKEIINR